jgi:hypothetical protein
LVAAAEAQDDVADAGGGECAQSVDAGCGFAGVEALDLGDRLVRRAVNGLLLARKHTSR